MINRKHPYSNAAADDCVEPLRMNQNSRVRWVDELPVVIVYSLCLVVAVLLVAVNLNMHKFHVVNTRPTFSQRIKVNSTSTTAANSTCRITSDLLPVYNQDQRLKYNGSSRVLFLLGASYTGTSALTFLLGTSGNVSLLGHTNKLGPETEGWTITGLKSRTESQAWKS
mmetsp:Transcript_12142/g.13920  ORF Transcript_12142/g.13920 Transcript_12142/m.13920 type:complete len:168 (+) Transcript_12142:16-519(+)